MTMFNWSSIDAWLSSLLSLCAISAIFPRSLFEKFKLWRFIMYSFCYCRPQRMSYSTHSCWTRPWFECHRAFQQLRITTQRFGHAGCSFLRLIGSFLPSISWRLFPRSRTCGRSFFRPPTASFPGFGSSLEFVNLCLYLIGWNYQSPLMLLDRSCFFLDCFCIRIVPSDLVQCFSWRPTHRSSSFGSDRLLVLLDRFAWPAKSHFFRRSIE